MNSFEKYFGDTYEFIEVIKSDEKNFVARIFDKSSKRLCMIKKRNLKSAELYKILKSLNDSHIPEIYRMIELDGNFFVIEEHIDGQTLDEILTYQIKNFDEKFITNIFLQICDCLKILHEKNIIHRDLTLSNIMLTKNNSVKIIDFGIARIFDSKKISDTEFLGTRGYAAPEQYGLFDLEQSDSRTDIFILGTAMKKLLGENYHGFLEKILNRCTNLNPELRYQNISELIQDTNKNKKIFFIKKIFSIFSSAVIIFFITQINFENKKDLPSEKVEEKILQDDKPTDEEKISEEKIKFPEIKFPDTSEIKNLPEIKIPDTPKTENLPSPIEKIPEPAPEIKKADKPKIFLYVNGKLTENYGVVSGYIFVDGFENWKTYEKNQYSKYFLFPDDWTAQLKIENFTDKDLINPKIIVSFSEDKNKIIIDRPTIKTGQIDYVDIPIANRLAMSIIGVEKNGKINIHGSLHIELKSSDVEKIQLIKYLTVSDEE